MSHSFLRGVIVAAVLYAIVLASNRNAESSPIQTVFVVAMETTTGRSPPTNSRATSSKSTKTPTRRSSTVWLTAVRMP
jgi:hypothetical protein